MKGITDFSGLDREQLTDCIRYGLERLPALREKMILRKAAGKSFYALKVEYVQLRRLVGLMQFWRGWAHDLPAYQVAHADEIAALREFLNTPPRPTLRERLRELDLR